jgi:hypothetical protein
LTQKVSKSVELEKKVHDLEQKLQVAYSKSEEQVSKDVLMGSLGYLIAYHLSLATNHIHFLQAKDAVQLRSREFTLDSSAISSKQSDRSKAADMASPNPIQQEVQEPSGIMAFKFILGVALLSILIGVFLGKRY